MGKVSNQNKDLQRDDQNRLFYEVKDLVSKTVLANKNKARTWIYGYSSKYDMVVISKNGQIGQIVNINGLSIALPKLPENITKNSQDINKQYWIRKEIPKELSRIQSIFQWNEMASVFKNKWVDYIEREFDRREDGYWFYNKGKPTYMTGSHYMYLQWTSIDIGYPDFREANRIFFIFWEACKADNRCFGLSYLKIRRSGFSFMGSSECVNTGTLVKDSRVGILSKTGSDAKKCLQIK